MKHGSLFTGVGGIDLGFEAAGIDTVWQCEIDKQARSVLAYRFPNATRYTDVCEVNGADVTPVDVITFGSPCQDLSVAGKRAGFADGTRSNLYFEAVRIIKEMRDATGNQYPRYAIWENVRGALSSNGGYDFHAAVQALADIGAVDIYWRVVNTCHFGPPQRRVRVFVVADFGGETSAQILAQPARLCWHPDTLSEKGQDSTGETEEGSRGRGGIGILTVYTKGRRAMSADDYETWETGRPAPTLNVSDNTGDTRATVLAVTLEEDYRVRRLTPRECERLQGWPDDHTRYGDGGREISDSARYKMAGNGVSAPVAQWIGENLMAGEQ